VPGAARGTGSVAGTAVLSVAGTDALMACNWAALAGVDFVDADFVDPACGFGVCASAVKLDDELAPTCHAAAAKQRQEIPVTIRTDERRKRSSAKCVA